MGSSVIGIGDRRRAGAERDAALARLSGARRALTLASIGLVAAFTAMASGATPAFNKHRGSATASTGKAVVVRPSSAWPRGKRHRQEDGTEDDSSSAASSASTPSPSASSAPAAPSVAPAPTPQAPAVTSGGS